MVDQNIMAHMTVAFLNKAFASLSLDLFFFDTLLMFTLTTWLR